jgi:hypothetical protein
MIEGSVSSLNQFMRCISDKLDENSIVVTYFHVENTGLLPEQADQFLDRNGVTVSDRLPSYTNQFVMLNIRSMSE